jgi:hypothetical protein
MAAHPGRRDQAGLGSISGETWPAWNAGPAVSSTDQAMLLRITAFGIMFQNIAGSSACHMN